MFSSIQINDFALASKIETEIYYRCFSRTGKLIMKINSVESISEVVKVRRKQLGLTQSETAAMCNFKF